jgi:hypothetical protein
VLKNVALGNGVNRSPSSIANTRASGPCIVVPVRYNLQVLSHSPFPTFDLRLAKAPLHQTHMIITHHILGPTFALPTFRAELNTYDSHTSHIAATIIKECGGRFFYCSRRLWFHQLNLTVFSPVPTQTRLARRKHHTETTYAWQSDPSRISPGRSRIQSLHTRYACFSRGRKMGDLVCRGLRYIVRPASVYIFTKVLTRQNR